MIRKNKSSKIHIPKFHIEWSWENTESLHEYWLQGGINDSNIQVGDVFSLGKIYYSHGKEQLGIISGKRYHIDIKNGNYISYNISGDIGGHWYNPKHEWFLNGHPIWIPSISDLLQLNYINQAEQLIEYYRDNIYGKK